MVEPLWQISRPAVHRSALVTLQSLHLADKTFLQILFRQKGEILIHKIEIPEARLCYCNV